MRLYSTRIDLVSGNLGRQYPPGLPGEPLLAKEGFGEVRRANAAVSPCEIPPFTSNLIASRSPNCWYVPSEATMSCSRRVPSRVDQGVRVARGQQLEPRRGCETTRTIFYIRR